MIIAAIKLHIQNLDSKKLTERRNAVKELDDALHKPETVEALNIEHKDRPRHESSIWSRAFVSAHKAVELENEDILAKEQKKGSAPLTFRSEQYRRLSAALVGHIVKKANEGEIRLSYSDILSSCLKVFREEALCRNFGQDYFIILSKNFLPVREYRCGLKNAEWIQLLERLVKLWDDPSKANVQTFAVLEALRCTVFYGTMQSPLSLQVKNELIRVLVKHKSNARNPGLQESYMKLVQCVCSSVALECRTSVCYLGEVVISSLFDSGELKLGKRSIMKCLIFEFILFQIRCHHPGGALQGSDTSYASDWSIWKRCLLSAFRTVMSEFHCINNGDIVSPSLVDLAVELGNQIFRCSDCVDACDDESFVGPAAKKRRVSYDVQGILDEIYNLVDGRPYWQWLSFVSSLVGRYPQCFREQDFQSLLSNLVPKMNKCKEPSVMAHLFRCCEALLHVEHLFTSASDLWLIVWDTTLRTVGLNQCEEAGHSLLWALIYHGKMSAAGVRALLKLYKSRTLRRSDYSVKTLIALCSVYALPDSVENAQVDEVGAPETRPGMERCMILNWLIPTEETEFSTGATFSRIIAEAVVPLILKSQTKTDSLLKKCDKCSPPTRGVSKLEDHYITTSFGGGLLVEVTSRSTSEQEDTTNDCEDTSPSKLIDQPAKKQLDAIVKARCEILHSRAEEVAEKDGRNRAVQEVCVKLGLQLTSEAEIMFDVVSMLSKHGVITDVNMEDWSVAESVRPLMENLGKVATKVIMFENRQRDSSSEDHSKILSFMTRMKELIANNLKTLGSESLWAVLSKDLIIQLFSALQERAIHETSLGDELRNSVDRCERDGPNTRLCDSVSELDVKLLSKYDQLRVVCVEMLCLFYTSGNMEDTIRERLWDKMSSKIKSHGQKLVATFHTTLTCARYAITMLEGNRIPYNISDLVQRLCRNWHADAEAVCIIIELLNDVMKHCKEKNDTLRSVVVIDLKAFLKKEFGPRFTVPVVQCLHHLSQVDSESVWGRWELPDSRKFFSDTNLSTTVQDESLIDEADREFIQEGESSLLEELVYYITSPFFEVRLAAVRHFAVLVAETTTHTQYIWQKTLIARSFCAAYKLFSIQETNWTTEEKIDEAANRTATVIHLLMSLIVMSTTWRKRALRFLIFLVKEKNVSIGLIQKALKLIKEPMKLKRSNDLLLDNFEFLLDGWMEKKYDLLEFPYQLFGHKDVRDFLLDMEHRIIPVLLIANKFKVIEAVCNETERSLKQILESNFAPIIARVFPIYASNDSARERDAHRVYNHCEEALTKEGVSRYMQLKIDGVLEYVTMLLWDRDHCVCLLGEIPLLPEMGGGWISHEKYLQTLKYIQKTAPDTETELLVLLGRSKPIVLQKVMLKLRERVVLGSTSLDHRILALYQYCAFVQKLAEHLGAQFHDMAEFLVRDVSHTLLHLVRSDNRIVDGHIIPIASCRYLQVFYESILPRCKDAVQRLLPTLVSVLVPIAQRSEFLPVLNDQQTLASCSLKLLHLLIVVYARDLAPTIAQLPSFPKGIIFDEMRRIHVEAKYKGKTFSLDQEINHFLCSVDVSLGKVALKCPLEGLQFLRAQLSERKEELKTIYGRMSEMRGFSEDCAKSSLHQLICVLARLSTGTNKKVRLEAACCLGELGITSLQTLILRPESHHAAALLASTDTTPLARLVAHAVSLLSNYLFDEEVAVVKSAGEALTALLASCEGHQVVGSSSTSSSVPTLRRSLKVSVTEEEQGNRNLMRSLVVPFLANHISPGVRQVEINEEVFSESLDSANIWYPCSEVDHAQWIAQLTTALLLTFSGSSEFLRKLVPLCQVKVAFAEELLPLLLSLVLSCKSEICHGILSKRIAEFFKRHTLLSSANGAKGSACVCMNQASVQCMLNAVHLMRIQQGPKTCLLDPILKLNYLHVAKAAQFCAAYFSSVMYAEFWFEGERRRVENEDRRTFGGFQSLPPIDQLTEENSEDGRTLQALLFEAYTRIGDTDAVYGCGSSFILDSTMRMSHCKEMGFWEEILNSTNFTLSRGPNMTACVDLVAALGEGNLLHVQDVYLQSTLQSVSENTEEMKPYLLECLWRLGRWDVPLQVQSMEKAGFEWHQFAALRHVHHGNALGAAEEVEAGRLLVMSHLAHASLESCASIYKPLTKLQALQEIEDAVKGASVKSVDALLLKWQKQDLLGRNSFSFVRRILEQRSCILQSAMSLPEFREMVPTVRRVWTDHMLHTVKVANTEGKPQVAKGFLQTLRNIPQQNESTLRRCKLEEAQLEWNVGNGANNHRARFMLRSLLNDLVTIYRGSEMDTILYADVLRLYGTWMAETRNEQPQLIIEKYFRKAIDVLESLETEEAKLMRLETHACLAKFADQQYQRVASYLSSEKFETKKQMIVLMQSATRTLERSRSVNKDDRKAIYINSKNSELEKEEVSTILRQCDFFLDLALRSYAETLLNSDKDNLLAFRLLSLWLHNPNKSETVASFLKSIPSHKFVPLLCQLSAHISDQTDTFSNTVNKFIERCAIDHPHHTLPIVLALAKSYEDRLHTSGGKQLKMTDQEPRVRGAVQLVETLRANNNLGKLVKAMELLFSALISLAYHPAPGQEERGQKATIPENHKIRRLGDMNHVLLPTVTLDVRKDRNYDNIVGIHQFEDEFSCVGGINVPKKIICKGTDGVSRPILVKGQDDLRQDAVMQQVFAVMNTLLNTSKETQQRRLKIRTYKVVPLSQRSGIIEWCVNTVPLENVLSGVHKRYYPNDLNPTKARAKLEGARKGAQGKLDAYEFICSRLHPAFRYHFIESYQTPSAWFERRLAYIHSVATNSMVGYILGLGDRHVQNILMDLNSAEVVHIDFGIAFEQGRILPSPETVPFRLTRDIEDGMGLSGVEGVFRRCCEKTMTVLRRNEGTILAILEVLLYDPLFEWTKTPKKVAMRQLVNNTESSADDSMSSEKSNTEVNAMAERALLRLHQKLQGTEEGSASSIEGQVNRLIQEARDPANLCLLFPGWKPFL